MKNALLEIKEKFRPDRIIVECSGSAFPATLAFQIRELERETNDELKLDAIVTVIDAENFSGYEDTSPTAKMQASYSDIILINKWEHVDGRALDLVLDHLNTLNDLTPKIRCDGRNGVDPNLLFGVDTKLVKDLLPEMGAVYQQHATHHDEVQSITIFKGFQSPHTVPDHNLGEAACNCLQNSEVPHFAVREGAVSPADSSIDEYLLQSALTDVSKETIWRIKGFVRLTAGVHILNWAFGRYELMPCESPGHMQDSTLRLTVMGERGEVKRSMRKFCATLKVEM
ncbi:hypothetical protein PAXRUDRAFT_833195, partial [Paxillus rubicundulus Ve08.2h10]